MREEGRRHAEREEERGRREAPGGGVGGEGQRARLHEHGAGRHAEQGGGHGEEGEVVPHRDAEDPREEDLVHERRSRDREDAAERGGAAGERGRGWAPIHRRSGEVNR